MPRSSYYLLPGYTYHLTQRCHGREFLLRLAKDRDTCREWLRVGVQRYNVPVYGYCITSNHIHVLAHADDEAAISAFMHLVTGATAKRYNVRKERTGSMWEHPFHCTAVESGRHLLNCLAFDVSEVPVKEGALWSVRETSCSYNAVSTPQKAY